MLTSFNLTIILADLLLTLLYLTLTILNLPITSLDLIGAKKSAFWLEKRSESCCFYGRSGRSKSDFKSSTTVSAPGTLFSAASFAVA